MRFHKIISVTLAAMVTAVLASMAFSQDRGGGLGRTPADPEQYKALMEKYRKDTDKMYQNTVGATDEDWKVLGPKVEKVSTQKKNLDYLFVGTFPEGHPDELKPPADLTTAAQNLSKLLANKDSKNEDIQAAMKVLRDAKAKAKEDLQKSRAALKELLTLKQEAMMVLNGLLD